MPLCGAGHCLPMAPQHPGAPLFSSVAFRNEVHPTRRHLSKAITPFLIHCHLLFFISAIPYPLPHLEEAKGPGGGQRGNAKGLQHLGVEGLQGVESLSIAQGLCRDGNPHTCCILVWQPLSGAGNQGTGQVLITVSSSWLPSEPYFDKWR